MQEEKASAANRPLDRAGEELLGRPFAVVGAGICGLSLAHFLLLRGADVLVVEMALAGAGATGAAAGVLNASRGGASRLGLLAQSALLGYERFVRSIEARSGLAVEHRRIGKAQVVEDGNEAQRLREKGLDPPNITWLDSFALDRLVPSLALKAQGALFSPQTSWVRPSQLVMALKRSVEALGGRVVEGSRSGLGRTADCRGWRLAADELAVGPSGALREVLVAAGAWTSPLLDEAGGSAPARIVPVRGQMIEVDLSEPLHTIVEFDGRYVIPCAGNRAWVGATTEEVGYDPRVTDEGVASLLAGARRILRGVGAVRRSWAGLRPKLLRRGGPLEGEGEPPVLAGHYKSGILLGPVTAQRMAERLAGLCEGEGGPFPALAARLDHRSL